MKNFEEIGTEIGNLVEAKNAAYGSSFAKAGAYLRLLFPNGLSPDRYDDALLLARDFDKSMRIATDRDAFGESPWQDKAGYAILGTHMHWQKKEQQATWQGNANGLDAANSPKEQPASAPPSASATTTTSASATAAPEPSQPPASSSEAPRDATARDATEAARPSVDALERDWFVRSFMEILDNAYPRSVDRRSICADLSKRNLAGDFLPIVGYLQERGLIEVNAIGKARLTQLGRASLIANRIAEEQASR